MKIKILLFTGLIFIYSTTPALSLDPPYVVIECSKLNPKSNEYKSKNCEQAIKNFTKIQKDWIEHISRPAEEKFIGIISEIIIDNPTFESGGLSPLATKIKIGSKWITLDFSKQKNIKNGTITRNNNVFKLIGEYPENLAVGDRVEVFAYRQDINIYTIMHENNINNSNKYYVKILDKNKATNQ